MKILTVYQPWASLIALGAKKYETRSWATSFRGPLAIHAAKTITPGGTLLAENDHLYKQALGILPKFLVSGAILSIGTLVDCVQITEEYARSLGEADPQELAFGDYTPGRFAWMLEDVHQFKTPIPARGMQRLWNFNEAKYLAAIDPYAIGDTKIWTPKGVISGIKLDKPDEDAVMGLEVM